MRRRVFLGATLAAGVAAVRRAAAQTSAVKMVQTPLLDIGYVETGNPQGFPVILLHGFPDDVHAYDEVAPPLAKAGHRVIVPWLRGFGPTRLRNASAPKTGEQAAIGQDLLDLADGLKLPQFAVGGFDWGGRAAGVIAALHPERVKAAVLVGGYTIQNVFAPPQPGPPQAERALWYQWYFNTERGRAGLAVNRKSFCKLLWQEWSPGWNFSEAAYDLTAPSFENPDFVDVVIHSYRHRNGNAEGEQRFIAMEQELAKRPKIDLPVITLYGANDGIARPAAEASPAERAVFPKLVAHRVVQGAGHFLPREKPEAMSAALLELLK